MTQRSRRFLVLAALLALSGCKGDDAPVTTTGDAAGAPLRMTVTVNPPGPDGRRAASVKLESPTELSAGQLSFTLPDGCRIVAGAAMRPIAGVSSGHPVQQELAFECDPGVDGKLTVTFGARDPSGHDVKQAVETGI